MTWNAGASTPGTLKRDDRDSEAFKSMVQSLDSPDILVFGFQELVDLEDKKMTASKTTPKQPGAMQTPLTRCREFLQE